MQIHCIANFNFFRIYLSLFDRKEHKLYKEHIVHCFPLIDRSCLFISFREQGNYQFGFGIHRIFSLLLSRDYCQKVNTSSTLNPKSFLLAADGKCVPYIVFDCLKFVTLGRQRTQDDPDNPTRSQLSSRGERILFFGPNTNTNIIRNQNFDRIRIRIIFVFSE